jgi:hypothetical protein
MLATNGRDADEGGGINEIDNHIHEIVYQSFLDSNIYMKNGMVLGIYRILGVASVLISISGVLNSDKHKTKVNIDPVRSINVYSILLPISVVAYDFTVQKMLNRYEFLFLRVSKYVWIMTYWAFILFAYVLYQSDVKNY